jgi:F-type H+-transporting ATPase subunit b
LKKCGKKTQANLAESRKEAMEIIARATKTAEEVKNEIMTKATEEAASMKNKALADIQAATEQARQELRETAALLAIMAAEKILDRAINEEDHKKLAKQFIDEAGDLLC